MAVQSRPTTEVSSHTVVRHFPTQRILSTRGMRHTDGQNVNHIEKFSYNSLLLDI